MNAPSYVSHYSSDEACSVMEALARLVETSEYSFPAARADLADRLRSLAWTINDRRPPVSDEDEVNEWQTILLRTLANGDALLDHEARLRLS